MLVLLKLLKLELQTLKKLQVLQKIFVNKIQRKKPIASKLLMLEYFKLNQDINLLENSLYLWVK